MICIDCFHFTGYTIILYDFTGSSMEHQEDKLQHKKNGISKNIKPSFLEWTESITDIDISGKDIVEINNVRFPTNLINLNLSGNKLKQIPESVLEINNLKALDLSNNNINYFYDVPVFCHTIERLNLANNDLRAMPYWLWIESPEKLIQLDLSDNISITNFLDDVIIKELLQYKVLATDLKIYNCKLINHIKLLETFKNVRILKIGSNVGMRFVMNCVNKIPCKGLDTLCDIQRLDVSNTQLYEVHPSIDMYKSLVEINLSHNYIRSLPKSFCNLENLEVCILSFNKILYLPENVSELKKLVALYLDSNELCMLPEKICELPALKILDLYDNSLYEVPEEIRNIQTDLALNYLDEPLDEEYAEKKQKLRLNNVERCDRRKVEIIKSDSEHSSCTSDDELDQDNKSDDIDSKSYTREVSSPEDWDSDDYWIPHDDKQTTSHQYSPWEYFLKRKIEEGNFVPIDQHVPSISESVKYMKLCNPESPYESDGQFDDYSEDDS